MPRTREAFEEMRVKSKNQIMSTALKLFSEKGYHATSISMIAKEAGIAAGLMYNYFSGKEDLLEKIMDDNFQYIYAYIRQNIAKQADVMKPATLPSSPADIEKLIDITFEAIRGREESWKLLISVMFQPDVSQIARKRIEQINLHQEQIYLGYFKGKSVRKPEISAKVLAAIMHGAFLNFAYSGDSDEIRLLRETVIKKLLEDGV